MRPPEDPADGNALSGDGTGWSVGRVPEPATRREAEIQLTRLGEGKPPRLFFRESLPARDGRLSSISIGDYSYLWSPWRFKCVREVTGLPNARKPHVASRARLSILLTAIALAVLAVWVSPLSRYTGWAWRRMFGGATVEQRLAEYGPAARNRLRPHFQRAGLPYPPTHLALIGIKDRKVLEVWARDGDRPYMFVRTYPVLAASGHLGPKLREGDRQVPEGLYGIESLHPNSRFHLALRVDYPNEFDRRKGLEDGRTNLGGDIMIHGSNCSVGCLAMGDPAAEDLFVLVADTGIENARIILTPVDFRTSQMPADVGNPPPWADALYSSIRQCLSRFVAQPARAGHGQADR